MRIHERVREYIQEKNLSVAAVAKKAGIPVTTLAQMLNGEQAMDSDALRAVCYALNVSAATFIKLKGTSA